MSNETLSCGCRVTWFENKILEFSPSKRCLAGKKSSSSVQLVRLHVKKSRDQTDECECGEHSRAECTPFCRNYLLRTFVGL